MDILGRLSRMHGAARVAELVTAPSDRGELRRLLREGAVVRAGRGVVAVPSADDAVVLARRASARITCVTLLARLRLPLLAPAHAVHLALDRARGAPPWPPTTARFHWAAGLDTVGGPTAVPLAHALVHAGRCLPFAEHVAVVDAALGRGLVRRRDLEALRPGSGRVAFDRLLRATDGRAGSLPESALRLGLVGAGLRVEPQVTVEGVGRTDLLVDRRLLVETDGYAFHTDRAAFAEDRRRDRTATLLGARTLRFTYDDSVLRTGLAVHEVRSVVADLRRAGVPPLPDELVRVAPRV